ncbi:MAG: hypothetical protein B1H07_03145 [Campylobacteraceae bacterium 4484_166]|nr:MAG: hypothetical protein B1H07_03145 [Campylobacteraceae bacterium 4484_166]
MKKIYILSLFLLLVSYADDKILQKDRLDDFDLSLQKIEKESFKESLLWINPIGLSYIKNENENIENEQFMVSIDQPIFKSGGIYHAVRYATVNEKYQKLNNKLQKRVMIKDAYKTIFELKKLDINIIKTKLEIQNKNINVKQKKEELLSGFTNISTLNSAIMELNRYKTANIDLQMQKEILLNSFKNLSDKNYKTFALPKLSLKLKKIKINNDLYIKRAIQSKELLRYRKNLIISNYLPTLSLTYNYIDDMQNDQQTNTRGFKVSMPLNVTVFQDIQSAKISYLRAKTKLKLDKNKQKRYYKRVFRKLRFLDKKIEIEKENIAFYEKLLQDIKEQKAAGFKSSDDIKVIANSKMIESLNLKLYKIDKNIELLELYSIQDEL